MVEVIPLKYGVTFKRVFSKPEVFTQFVFDLLGITLNISEVKTEYEYPESVGYVRIKYDLFAEDTEKRTIVEVQHIKQQDFFDRFLYYHIIGLIEQARTYQGYRFGKSVYTIVVLTSVPEDKSSEFSHGTQDMSFLTEFGNRFSPYPHRLIVLVPRNVNEQTPAGIKDWLELIKDSLDTRLEESDYPSDMFQQVIAAIKRTMITPDELAYIKEQESLSMTQIGWRKDGYDEALVTVARRLKQQGSPIALIAQVTGLSEAEIEQIG